MPNVTLNKFNENNLVNQQDNKSKEDDINNYYDPHIDFQSGQISIKEDQTTK